MKKNDAIAGLFSDVEHYICSATDILSNGEYVRLFDLEGKVRDLCQAVSAIPLEEGRRYAGKLDDLHRQLDTLQHVMETHRGHMRDQLATLDVKRKANRAYAKSEVMGKQESD